MLSKANEYKRFNQIVNSFYNEELESLENTEKDNKAITKEYISIEPKIIYDKQNGNIKVEIFIGNKTMYKISELSKFYDRMENKENYKYGDKLEFIHTKLAFDKESTDLLNFVLKYAQIIKYANTNSNSNYRFGTPALNESVIILDESGLDEIFEILQNRKIKFQKENEEQKIEFVPKNPDIKFNLDKTNQEEYVLYPNVNILKIDTFRGNKYLYLLINNKLYRCNKKFEKTTMRLLNEFIKHYSSQIKLGTEQLPALFSIIMPKIKNNIVIEEETKKEIEKYLPQKLKVKMYIDFDENNYLIANLKFVYNDKEFNPLGEEIKKQVSRNIIEETRALNLLRKTGFMLDTKKLRFVLVDEEKIYEFANNEINTYIKHFEVFTTDNYKTKQIKYPKIKALGVKIENDLLKIDLSKINIDAKELIEIMEKYRLKKKYHRLKDGTFLSLDENEDMNFLDKLITGTEINIKDLETGVIRLPVHRSLYLNQLLENMSDVEINKNSKYDEIVNQLDKNKMENNIEIPYKLSKTLRYYQKTGFKWLKVLDSYKFGGILADDMGLGKTIQVLSIIMSYIEETKENERRASLVIAPSSLALNWQNEANKFASDLKTLVIHGSSQDRKGQIENIENYDLVITSYDLLKRDIEIYNEKNYRFRYVIADEAQYLKNSNTQNAISIKQINADTRYALTGTPMENSLSELWSIFDFIMPGYLFSYRKFKNTFEIPIVKDEDKAATKKLKMLIEPFVLRRTKEEVLKELPEKTITVLTSDMQEEQRKLYMTYLAEAKQEVRDAINVDGFDKSHMKILAVLTRLRQICCHPSLFIEGYEAGSSKLEQCMELIKEGASSGRKILLFSGYTSMFPIIEKELEKNNIKYFKLTGSTKVDERVNLVNEFNNDESVKVFLISLKAGGTGLNLTGADMVIHYDPWWNASAENQATDRAYRIGQKRNVQVYKLITKDSIEEKIYKLQQNKSALVDNMLNINTAFINRFSKEEIMELFE